MKREYCYQQNDGFVWNRFALFDKDEVEQNLFLGRGDELFVLESFASYVWLSCYNASTKKNIEEGILTSRLFNNISRRVLKDSLENTLRSLKQKGLISHCNPNHSSQLTGKLFTPRRGNLNGSTSSPINGFKPPPHLFKVFWHWTNKCNFDCIHCFSRKDSYEAELSTRESLEVAQQIYETGVFDVHFGGGENLLRDDLFVVLNYLTRHHVNCSLGSNGFNFSNEIAKKLLQSGVKTVVFSLDSCSPKIHDHMRRRPGSFNNVIDAIKIAKNHGLHVCLQSTLIRQNLPHLQDFIDLAHKHRVDEVSFRVVKIGGNVTDVSDILLSAEELKRTFDFLKIAEQKYRKIISIRFFEGEPYVASMYRARRLQKRGADSKDYIVGCHCGDTTIAIKPDGSVVPCGYVKLFVGNVKNNHLHDIWRYSPLLLNLRKAKNRPAEGPCKKCASFPKCRGGCIIQTLNIDGNNCKISGPDPNCWKADGE